jgi:ubiquinone/menaquinone biosynthesis C-methylase UbiE
VISEKEAAELAFWESRIQLQGVLSNDHFEYFYTTHFGLTREFYTNKKILDIGCGPRGSLEWATEASVRIGLDPLADAYRKLGTDQHAMEYVACGAEQMPFPDGAFDVVCSLNSLDHVDDLERVISEIVRVIAPGGQFLLLTDIHREPTTLEPAAFSWDVLGKFLPALEIREEHHFEYAVWSAESFGDIYQSLRRAVPFDHADSTERYGILSARLLRRP